MSDEIDYDVLNDDLNAFFLLFGSCMVFFMQAGFAVLEVGAIPHRLGGRVLLKNIFDACIGALSWWAFGYALAYGSDSFQKNGDNGFIGRSGFFYENQGTGEDASPLTGTRFARTYGQIFWSYQYAFAGVATTIVSGALCGRCTFFSYAFYSFIISGFIYPIIVHMAWSDDGRFSAYRDTRLVAGCGVVDFAGSGVVHLTGGFSALILTNFVAPRRGRFPTSTADAERFERPPDSGPAFSTLGVFILWTGWFAFNGCSTLAVTNGSAGIAAHAVFNTMLAASAACLSGTIISAIHTSGTAFWCCGIEGEGDDAWWRRRDHTKIGALVDISYTLNSVLAGLVSITAGCAVMNHWGALITGTLAGILYYLSSRILYLLKIDDVVDAFPVHGICGAFGVLATGFFATPFYYKLALSSEPGRADRCAGIFYGGTGGTLASGAAFILVVSALVGACLVPLFLILHAFDVIDLEKPPPPLLPSTFDGATTSNSFVSPRASSLAPWWFRRIFATSRAPLDTSMKNTRQVPKFQEIPARKTPAKFRKQSQATTISSFRNASQNEELPDVPSFG
mmetsp:Transcript_7688/g.11607  ORF Transcript_7688/g.11607 Transcript_7688/m.11607 type:complete len:565 (+) Transcript_7688:25-1719(+)